MILVGLLRIYTLNYNYQTINYKKGIINEVYNNRFIIDDTIIYSDNKYSIGDFVEVLGTGLKIENNRIFNLFNNKKYLLSKGIKYEIYPDIITYKYSSKNILYKIKKYIINKISSKKNKVYLNAFILGNNKLIDSKVLKSYQINGISHLFAISGMHITLVSFLLLQILNKIKKTNINSVIVCIFLLFFIFLTGFTKSVIRSTSLYIVITVNKYLKLNLSIYRIIIYILLINLVINPYNIYNTGFIFSYTISIYLMFFNKLIKKHKNYFTKIFITSLISFLVSIPILINTYFSINLLTIINNIIFIPLVTLLIFPLCLINIILPIDDIVLLFIKILEATSLFLSNINISIIMHKASTTVIILYYLLITLILYRRKYIYSILLIITLIIHTNINNIIKTKFITYIDVGQGDSILMHLNDTNILIDTGGNINYDLSINTISYLKSEGIKKLNYLILTHSDFDHSGAAIDLVNNFKIDKVIFNCGAYNNLENELINVLNKKKISYYSCINELNIDNNKLYFLQTSIYDNENDNSNVIYTEINGYKFMFMGDASSVTEKEIINKYNIFNIDVLKVGHHGSKTSSSKEFIKKINPRYSIISVGKNNRYGHPNKEVLNNLQDSKIYRTDQDGSIMFKIKSNKLKIETCKP